MLHAFWMTCTDFRMKQNISKFDLSSPSPHHWMLGYFCRLLKALACPTLKRGRGVGIFPLLRRNRSNFQAFLPDCRLHNDFYNNVSDLNGRRGLAWCAPCKLEYMWKCHDEGESGTFKISLKVSAGWISSKPKRYYYAYFHSHGERTFATSCYMI